jgi:hypothetical protein
LAISPGKNVLSAGERFVAPLELLGMDAGLDLLALRLPGWTLNKVVLVSGSDAPDAMKTRFQLPASLV